MSIEAELNASVSGPNGFFLLLRSIMEHARTLCLPLHVHACVCVCAEKGSFLDGDIFSYILVYEYIQTFVCVCLLTGLWCDVMKRNNNRLFNSWSQSYRMHTNTATHSSGCLGGTMGPVVPFIAANGSVRVSLLLLSLPGSVTWIARVCVLASVLVSRSCSWWECWRPSPWNTAASLQFSAETWACIDMQPCASAFLFHRPQHSLVLLWSLL